jgi:tRNA G18 (ribose-2'-O)-methylase SpoU
MDPPVPDPILITDPDDPRVAAYRDIRERDLVGRQGLFVAEGEVVLRVLLRSTLHRPQSVLIAEKRWSALAPMLAGCEAPVYLASQGVLDAIAGFPMHRGILAIGRAGEAPAPAGLLAGLGAQAVVVCLFGIGNHDNMGGVFRNAAAFGADAVLLDADCCDPLYRKAIRVSVGAALVTPFARFAREEDSVAMLEAAGFQPLALSPSGAEVLARTRVDGRVAVLLGSEGPGLSPAVMARARTVRIPMKGAFDSLNVATTSAVVLHHLADRVMYGA